MDMTFINSIDWESLDHAYGPATNAPKALANLFGDDEDARDDAVYEFLYSSALHQYTTYSCTPFVIRCLVHTVENEDISGLEIHGAPLIREILHFILVCSRNSEYEPSIGSAVLSGEKCFRKFKNYPDLPTSNSADGLINFCVNYRTQS